MWKIDFHQNQVLARVLFEFWFGKDVAFKINAGTAPIGASEFEKEKLLVVLSLLLRLFVVSQPAQFDFRRRGGVCRFFATDR